MQEPVVAKGKFAGFEIFMVEGGISSPNKLLVLASLTADSRTYLVERLKPNTTYRYAVWSYLELFGFTEISLLILKLQQQAVMHKANL